MSSAVGAPISVADGRTRADGEALEAGGGAAVAASRRDPTFVVPSPPYGDPGPEPRRNCGESAWPHPSRQTMRVGLPDLFRLRTAEVTQVGAGRPPRRRR